MSSRNWEADSLRCFYFEHYNTEIRELASLQKYIKERISHQKTTQHRGSLPQVDPPWLLHYMFVQSRISLVENERVPIERGGK
jgi:hypothetical protein